jgi:membrane-associated phospholipid phosphatase
MLFRRAVAIPVRLFHLLKRLGWFYAVGLLVAATALVAFAMLTNEVLEGEVQDVNLAVLRSLHAHPNRALDIGALTLTWQGDVTGTICVSVLTWLFFVSRRRFLEAITLLLVVAGGTALMVILKHVFRQPRPDLFESLAPTTGYSYPSGHAMLSVCLYGYLAAVVVRNRPGQIWRWCAALGMGLLAAAIAWSRLYLGVHWLSDVGAGSLAALFWVACCVLAEHWARTHQRICT